MNGRLLATESSLRAASGSSPRLGVAAVVAMLAWLLVGLAACGGGGGETDTGPDVAPDVAVDTPTDPGDQAEADEADVCQPDCAGKQCGPDGCGATCGTCAQGSACDDAGTCKVVVTGCTDDASCDGECGALATCRRCACEQKECVIRPIAGCCTLDTDCVGKCAGLTACETCDCGDANTCEKSPVAGCCLKDGDCPVNQVCGGDHACVSVVTPCTAQPAAFCSGKCGQLGYCEACVCDAGSGQCAALATFGESCCTDAVAHCNDGLDATCDECPELAGVCVHKPCGGACSNGSPVTYFSANFDQGSLSQFEIYDDNSTADKVTWQLDATAPYSGAYSLYFGDPACHTYYTGALGPDCLPLDPVQSDAKKVRARIRTKEIALGTAGDPCVYALSFWAKLEGEAPWPTMPAQTSDQLKVTVQWGSASEQVYGSAVATGTNSTNGQWRLFAADLTKFGGKVIRIVFEFDSGDGSDNLHFGAAIDDVVVRSLVGASACDAAGCADDGKVCTSDACTIFANGPADTGLCGYFKGEAACEDCTTDPQCNGGGDCEIGACVDKVCTYSLDTTCCKNVLEGTVQKWDFGSGLAGWTVSAATDAQVTWHASPNKGVGGSGAAYFGNPLHPCADAPAASCPSYDNGKAVAATLESSSIVIPPGAGSRLLTFDLWLSTEWDGVPLAQFANPTGVDRLVLSVKVGSTVSPIWNSDVIGGSTGVVDADGVVQHQFVRIGLDVSAFRGMAASFVFTFASGDYSKNDYEGAYVDNVSIAVGCEPLCTSDTTCNDAKTCTKDRCVAGICEHEVAGECCSVKEDCDDGNVCTLDTCLGGLCKHPYLVDAGCCQEGTITGSAFDFEVATLPATYTVTVPTGSATTWQVRDDRATTGSRSLWFGNAQTGTYDNTTATGSPAQAIGTIELPAFKVPLGGTPVLEFDVYFDSEWAGIPALWDPPADAFAFDKLSVLANGVEVWNSFVYELAGSTCGTGCAFKAVQASLAFLAGHDVTLAFKFDSLDTNDNAHGGAFIDHVRVQWYCADYECFNSLECEDAGDPLDHCTRDRCESKQCFYLPTGAADCCYPVDVKTDGFEGAPQEVSFTGGSGAVKWQVTSDSLGGRVHGGQKSLYFGDTANKTYANGETAVSGEASWPLVVPAGLGQQLEWWQWLDLDAVDATVAVSDVFRVRVFDSANPGVQNVVFENKPTYGQYKQWTRRSASLDAFAGKSIVVVFSFASGDGQHNQGEGVYVDDLRVFKPCN